MTVVEQPLTPQRRASDVTADDFQGTTRRARSTGLIALVIRLLNAGLAYAVQILLARLLGQFEYGLYAFAWVCIVLLGQAGAFGFSLSSIRFLSAYRADGNDELAAGFLRVAVLIPLVLAGLIAGLGAWLLSSEVLPVADHYVMPLILAATIFPLVSVQGVLEGAARAHRWILLALIPNYLLRHGLLAIFFLGAIWLGFGATAEVVLLCSFAGIALSLVIQSLFLAQKLRRQNLRRRVSDQNVGRKLEPQYAIKEWVRISLPMALLEGAHLVALYADILILSLFVPPEQVALYFAVTRISQLLAFVRFAASAGTANLFSSLHTQGKKDELAHLARNTVSLGFLASCGICLGLIIAGPWLLSLFGPGFSAAYPVLIILLFGLIVQSAFVVAEDLLLMTEGEKISAKSYVGALIVNVALNFALIPNFGLMGAAAATSLTIAGREIYLAFVVRRQMGISLFGAQFSALFNLLK